MQAIQTKYLCPTNTKGGRIKATCARGSIVVEWDHALNPDQNHRQARVRLCAKFAAEDREQYGTPLNENPWSRHMAMGQLPDGSWAHVFVEG
jgi:hypothetical protein